MPIFSRMAWVDAVGVVCRAALNRFLKTGDGSVRDFPKALPKTIWIFWAQGLDEAPWIVQSCVQSWQERNPGWSVRVLDLAEARTLVDLPEADRGLSLAALSDILRIRLLVAHGGVWADATTYCARGLDDWLLPLFQGGFFAFSQSGSRLRIASWFLASEPGNEIAAHWSSRVDRYWAGRSKPGAYFWFHILFEMGLITNGRFRRLWRKVPKIDADGPHVLQRLVTGRRAPDIETRAAVSAVGVHKLCWKRNITPESLMDYGLALYLPENKGAKQPVGVKTQNQ